MVAGRSPHSQQQSNNNGSSGGNHPRTNRNQLNQPTTRTPAHHSHHSHHNNQNNHTVTETTFFTTQNEFLDNHGSGSGNANEMAVQGYNAAAEGSPSLVRVKTWYTVAKQGVSC